MIIRQNTMSSFCPPHWSGLMVAVLSLLLSNAGAGITSGSTELGAIWFIGDSITQSNADGDAGGSPRKALYDLLIANGYTFTYTGHFTENVDGLPTTGSTAADNLYHYHSGISGSVIGDDYSSRTGMTRNMTNFWTSGRLAWVKPNIILIMLGANDVNLALDLPGAPDRLRTLIQTIYDLPDVGDPTIFLAKITPNRSDDPQDSTNVAAFNAAVSGVVGGFIAQDRDVRIVDQFTPINENYAANMRPDDLHPNAAGNAVMAQQWFNAITEKWSGTLSDFNSYDKYSFETNGLNCLVTVPKVAAEGNPWVWRARFPGQVPELDIALLSNGFHVAYVGVAGLFGSPEAVERFDAFYEFLTQTYGFNRRAAMVGMSRGGLAVFNWARDNTDKVHCIYADAPVCDFKSWPGGFGLSDGSATQWAKCLTAYGFTEAEALAYEGNPVDNMESLATAAIPLLHVVGDADTTVPFSENTGVIETNYYALGGDMKVIHKPGVAHKHEIDNPTSTIVNFILNAVSADDHVPTLMSGASESNGNFKLQFSGTTGQHYRVESVDDLITTNYWLAATALVSLVESPMDVSIPLTNAAGFYRIHWLPWK